MIPITCSIAKPAAMARTKRPLASVRPALISHRVIAHAIATPNGKPFSPRNPPKPPTVPASRRVVPCAHM